MFIIDIILYFIACVFWPEQKTEQTSSQQNSQSEDVYNWIIMDETHNNQCTFPTMEDRPPQDHSYHEFDGGPDW